MYACVASIGCYDTDVYKVRLWLHAATSGRHSMVDKYPWQAMQLYLAVVTKHHLRRAVLSASDEPSIDTLHTNLHHEGSEQQIKTL